MSEGYHMNRILIDGHIGKDPEEFRTVTPGLSDNYVAKFTVASKHQPRGKEAETTWFNIVCFGHVAEGALSLKKGDRVFVEGRFESRKYKKKDGTEGQSWQVVASNVYLSVSKPRNQYKKDEPLNETPSIDEIPF